MDNVRQLPASLLRMQKHQTDALRKTLRKEDFQSQLTAASYLATHFGQDFVSNTLVYNFRYVISLNVSFDDNRHEDEIVYPEDDGKVIGELSNAEVVALLHRDCRCPQWIDISVAGASKEVTLLRLLCCGRFHDDESRLYYYEQGTQPFGIKSPDLPPGWKDGDKFKIETPKKAIENILVSRQVAKIL